MRRSTLMTFAAVGAALAGTIASTADAAVTVNLQQVGTNVIATSNGTLDLTGLTFVSGGYTLTSGVTGSDGYIGTGNSGSALDAYSGFTGPATFGTGNLVFGVGAGATPFGINGRSLGTPVAFVQSGYISGSAIASTLTFANSTFASLGLTQGTYAYTSRSDSITVTIGQGAVSGAVPEPAAWAMMIGGFGLIGGTMRRRRTTLRLA